MKKLFAITLMMVLASNLNAQDVYSVGSYNVNNGTIAALYKNGNRRYTALHSNQTSKATRVTCNSQGDVFWLVNFYDYPDGTYNHSEIRLNNHVYASNENHREVRIADMYCLNDTLYYAGYQYNEDSVLVATVWKGSEFETHWIMGDGIHPSSIAFSDIDKRTGIPYFCGYIIDEKKCAAIWKEQELLYTFEQDSLYEAQITSSYASQIAVENAHVYTIGQINQEGVIPIPALWKDNVLVCYVQPYFDDLHCICAFDNSYYYGYTSRWQYYDAIIKDDGSEVLQLGYAFSVQSTFNDIYVVGDDFDNKFYVWKNFEKQYQIKNCNTLYDMCVFDPFFEPHSEWYYEILNDNGSITYQHLECAADTTIGTERPKIIVRSNTIYDRNEHTEVTHEYVFERDEKVYWWNKDLEEFTTLYDLTAEAGDEWEIKVGTESILVHVDSVGVFNYDGENRRMLHISDAGDLFSGDIVVGYGHLTSFFPERLMNQGKGYRVEGLRCYWIGDELVYHDGDEDCDAIYSDLHGIDEDGPSTGSGTFAVYPNPTNNILFVETVCTPSLPDQTYRITNLIGQTMLTGHISAETQQIDISNLPAGMYFISVGGQTVKFVVK